MEFLPDYKNSITPELNYANYWEVFIENLDYDTHTIIPVIGYDPLRENTGEITTS